MATTTPNLGLPRPTETDIVTLANNQAVIDSIDTNVGMHTGMIAFFTKNSTPGGWLKANGAVVSRATYAKLFAEIGTTFGVGDGSTTFKLPDLRGEFLRGFDDGRGIDASRVLGSSQTDAFKSHGHDMQVIRPDVASQASIYANDNTGNAGAGAVKTIGNWGSTNLSTLNPGYGVVANGGTETRPRNIALLACIKY